MKSRTNRFTIWVLLTIFIVLALNCACSGSKKKAPERTVTPAYDPKPKVETPTSTPKAVPSRMPARRPTHKPVVNETFTPAVPYGSPTPGGNVEITPMTTPSITPETASPMPESTGTPETGGNEMEIKLYSSAFKEGDFIPMKYSGEGEDVSPPLAWGNVPEGTKSLVIICDDPDAPVGVWDHWVLFNIPPTTRSLAESVPRDLMVLGSAKQGNNSWGKIGYNGPKPPSGKAHRYFFKIYALDTELDTPSGLKKAQVEEAMKGHILGQGQLMGKYQR